MKVLVVGGSGFLGRPIVDEFLQRGFDVKSLSRHLYTPTSEVEFVQGDIFEAESYKMLLKSWQPELVVQAAWQTESGRYRTDPLNDLYATSTINFARNCFDNGTIKFIGLGSSAEYGKYDWQEGAAHIKFEPHDTYRISKIRTFQRLMKFAENNEVSISWARIFQPYGRNQDPARLVPSIVSYLRNKSNLIIHSPFLRLDWISSRDVASAIHFISSQSNSKSYDVGTGIMTSTCDLFYLIKELLLPSNTSIQFPGELRNVAEPIEVKFTSSSDALSRLGWSPSDSLETGLRWALQI